MSIFFVKKEEIFKKSEVDIEKEEGVRQPSKKKIASIIAQIS